MTQQPDYLLLAAGMMRVAIWSVGAVYAYRRHRPLAFAGFLAGVMSAVVFGFDNAHFDMPPEVTHTVTYMSPLIPGCIVASFILHAHSNRRWRI